MEHLKWQMNQIAKTWGIRLKTPEKSANLIKEPISKANSRATLDTKMKAIRARIRTRTSPDPASGGHRLAAG
ncbi:hypothetical protein N5D61_04125 [Pseudomonas sp. GD03842]|uniref:hypothetical protein n=1 Tax=Pseudomonas sp. GD03842 TaxID=2975385 RepID=UPI0024499031|nr:hypothetical protein [Pseudomonas sp. GD03842]MDH0745534.1 hypothetical protein [Pseudomonas sp. GD03842]